MKPMFGQQRKQQREPRREQQTSDIRRIEYALLWSFRHGKQLAQLYLLDILTLIVFSIGYWYLWQSLVAVLTAITQYTNQIPAIPSWGVLMTGQFSAYYSHLQQLLWQLLAFTLILWICSFGFTLWKTYQHARYSKITFFIFLKRFSTISIVGMIVGFFALWGYTQLSAWGISHTMPGMLLQGIDLFLVLLLFALLYAMFCAYQHCDKRGKTIAITTWSTFLQWNLQLIPFTVFCIVFGIMAKALAWGTATAYGKFEIVFEIGLFLIFLTLPSFLRVLIAQPRATN